MLGSVGVGVCACAPKCTQSQINKVTTSNSVVLFFCVVVAEQNWEQ